MNHDETFGSFFDEISLKGTDRYEDELKGVTKKLNQKYYSSDSESDNRLLVGSIGRGTAVEGTSDVDVLYYLPPSVYTRFDNYESNGQSALLQEIKNVLLEKYPRTEIKGDGQAVVISFKNRNYTIDLVPAFEQDDGSYKYPDSGDGGSWKITKPIPEQEQSFEDNDVSDGNFNRYCNALRIWKDTVGFKFGGLLIDTLVHNYIDDQEIREASNGYYEALTMMFEKLKNEDPNQNYWCALGSNQHVYDSGNGAFVRKAKKAYRALSEAIEDIEKEEALVSIFGKHFEDCIVESEVEAREKEWSAQYDSKNSEEFVELRWSIDIRYHIRIGCDVDQRGFRRKKLREMLKAHLPLFKNKKLTFFIEECDVPSPYDLYWKVRNVGKVAHERNQIRGRIESDGGRKQRIEHTHFMGPHYVECYAIQNGVCVARDRIDVPIDDNYDNATDFLT